jgi:hypothetical protein
MRDAGVLLVALGFLLMALGALIRPREVLAQFGIAVEGPAGTNEVRAVYGGFGIAVAVLLAVAALGDPPTAEGIVVAIAFALLGMAAGRIAGAMIAMPDGFHPVWTYFSIEVVAAALLLAAAWA